MRRVGQPRACRCSIIAEGEDATSGYRFDMRLDVHVSYYNDLQGALLYEPPPRPIHDYLLRRVRERFVTPPSARLVLVESAISIRSDGHFTAEYEFRVAS